MLFASMVLVVSIDFLLGHSIQINAVSVYSTWQTPANETFPQRTLPLMLNFPRLQTVSKSINENTFREAPHLNQMI